MQSLSVCMIVQNAEKTLQIALESLNSVYDELILVDGGSTDATCDIAQQYQAKIIHSPWEGDYSKQRNVYLQSVKTDWIFVLDSDEFINIEALRALQYVKEYGRAIEKSVFVLPRRWIAPDRINYYITTTPHNSDNKCRLLRQTNSLYYTGQVHEMLIIDSLEEQLSTFANPNICIYHLDLYINNEDDRYQKIQKYKKMKNLTEDLSTDYYLPELKGFKTAKYNLADELNPKTHSLLQKIMKPNFESQLNKLIPPEIKNDEFYREIQKIARTECIQTILEIGSSSGGGSTEAFVLGLRDNPSHPVLFCMEVSKPRFLELQRSYAEEHFVKCYNVSSVSLDKFATKEQVIEFYQNTQTSLNLYPLQQVLCWLEEDIQYVENSGINVNGIKQIKQENSIDFFDVVLIDGSEFTGQPELDEIYGARFILLDDINTFKNYHNHQRLLNDKNYALIASNPNIRNGYSVFKKMSVLSHQDTSTFEKVEHFSLQNLISSNSSHKNSTAFPRLPIHFFTIVLNGQPFIQYHIDVLKQLPCEWHWHIVEGVADLKHDTAWSLQLGGQITDAIHRNGLSKDGTSEYLDELAQLYPENITLYRKPEGVLWDGKLEMVNAPLVNIQEECLLWQIDVDELWTTEQINTVRRMFLENSDKTAAFYWCWYFVGEHLLISTRNCYTQNPQQEWLRTWRYKPGYVWAAHEPPILVEPLPDNQLLNIAAINPFSHDETEAQGLIFQHFAYVTENQLQFKEQYYGYANATSQWRLLQQQSHFPILLRNYFSWVYDNTTVDLAVSYGVIPIAQKVPDTKTWKFLQSQGLQKPVSGTKRSKPIIVVDGVFFQLYQTGIARVWRSLLEQWSKSSFAEHILVLNRVGTAPKIPNIRYRVVPAYSYSDTDLDRQMLQQVCDEEEAELFISTYYTTPIETPSVFMAYDMIPELLGADLQEPMWREKQLAIQHASAYIAISENTAYDLCNLYSDVSADAVAVAHCGVEAAFSASSAEEINNFKLKYGISKPYFLLVGGGAGYKNSLLFFQAFAQLPSKQGFDIVCTGSNSLLATDFRTYTAGVTVHMLRLDDDELRTAYSGAIALAYPSLYEGFGLPIVEAMASGCPVITCPNASIPEVAGDAALYVADDDSTALANALCEVQKPEVRQALIDMGFEQAAKFSWSEMAEKVSSALIRATLIPLNLREVNFIVFPDWSQPEEIYCTELAGVIRAIATHPGKSQMTLLINSDSIPSEDASLILSSITMSLLLEEELEVSDGPEISLVSHLSTLQWQTLLTRIEGRIALPHEDQEAIATIEASNLPVSDLETLPQLST